MTPAPVNPLRRGRRDRLACRLAVELIADHVDDALLRHDRRRLEEHLAHCPHCTEYLRQLRATRAAAGRLTTPDPDPDAVASLAQLYRDWHGSR